MKDLFNSIDPTQLWVIIAIIVGISLIVLCLCIENKRRKEREARYRCYIEHNSPRYLALLELNKRFDFTLPCAKSYTYYIHAKSKAQFDHYNFDRFVEEKIEANINTCLEYIQALIIYRDKYNEYKTALSALPSPVSMKDVAESDIPYEFYKATEADLVAAATQPFVEHHLVCQCNYISPKGRTSLQRQQTYSLNDIVNHYDIVLRRQTEKNTKEGQRKAMTNSMRYDIMKRDNFRCVLCGRSSADGAVLHVDHIVPVAKGGKSVPENLRTLCQECNSGKRDKYDPDGVN